MVVASVTSAISANLATWLEDQFAALVNPRGHALLLHGAAGLGQIELAQALMKTWLCEENSSSNKNKACGSCTSCLTLDARTHADALVLMPETQMLLSGWPLPEKAQSELNEKKRKPSKEIRVDALRNAVEFCQRTSARGGSKVVLIYPAEEMNHVAANTLLKTLEEPPPAVRFLLVSERAHLLLPTIRSRCLAHAMHWPSEDQALRWLQERGSLSAELAKTSLRVAGGAPAQALLLAQDQVSMSLARTLPRAIYENQSEVQAQFVTLAPAQQLAWLQKICQDLMRLSQGAPARYFSPEDLPPCRASLRILGRWARALLQQAKNIDHPFNASLMAQALWGQAHSVVRA